MRTSLTQALRDRRSPVSEWMYDAFPDPAPLLKQIRDGCTTAAIIPPDGIGHGTQAGAIDWWIRFMITSQPPDIHLLRAGLSRLKDFPVFAAAAPLLDTAQPRHSNAITVDRLLEYDDETQARLCYVMSLITECFRANIQNSRLFAEPAGSTVPDVLRLATKAEVTDLVRMRDAARTVLLPHVKGRILCGPTFDGSRDLAADADLIIGNKLVEIKATQGARPLADGKRRVRFERSDLYQILGYLLLDYNDQYKIRRLGLYAVRFDTYMTWRVDSFLKAASGRPLNLADLRTSFKTLLRRHAPEHMSALDADTTTCNVSIRDY